jgi:hypothetical protein
MVFRTDKGYLRLVLDTKGREYAPEPAADN